MGEDYLRVATEPGKGYLGADWAMVHRGRQVTVLTDEGPETDDRREVRFRVEDGPNQGLEARTRREYLQPR